MGRWKKASISHPYQDHNTFLRSCCVLAAMERGPAQRRIRVATDCSGLEAPLQALHALLPAGCVDHVFSSEIDSEARVQLQAVAQPRRLYHNLLLRDNEAEDTESCDVYVAGFPCQPFSRAGRGLGFADPRGSVFGGCAGYVQSKGPTLWILENVEGLLSNDSGRTFSTVMATLTQLTTKQGFTYEVHWRLLNAAEHGVAQNRPRVYIIGLRRDALVENAVFTWPMPVPCPPLEHFLDDRASSTVVDDSHQPCMVRQSSAARALWFLRHRVARDQVPEEHEVVLDIDASLDFARYMPNLEDHMSLKKTDLELVKMDPFLCHICQSDLA